MKRGSPDRNWDDAIEKCREEGECRVCGIQRGLDCAHIVPRKYDLPRKPGQKRLYVEPNNVLPLCSHCHYLFDAGELDVLEHLETPEELHIVGVLGLENARRRVAPLDYRRDIEAARVEARLAA